MNPAQSDSDSNLVIDDWKRHWESMTHTPVNATISYFMEHHLRMKFPIGSSLPLRAAVNLGNKRWPFCLFSRASQPRAFLFIHTEQMDTTRIFFRLKKFFERQVLSLDEFIFALQVIGNCKRTERNLCFLTNIMIFRVWTLATGKQIIFLPPQK